MKTGKVSFSELLKYYRVRLGFNYDGRYSVYTEDGFWGYLSRPYVKRVCRSSGVDIDKLLIKSWL